MVGSDGATEAGGSGGTEGQGTVGGAEGRGTVAQGSVDLDAVEGVTVGHWTDPVGRTGTTVVLMPEGTVASGEVRGGAPATRDLALLAPDRLVSNIDAICLTGGSAFGLAAAQGVMEYCEARGRGVATPAGPVPIVPTLALFDLANGDARARPDAEAGHAACVAATSAGVATGPVGAGTGATVGAWRGMDAVRPSGLGAVVVTAEAPAGTLALAAVIAVNAAGDIDVDGSATEGVERVAFGESPLAGTNTTIGAVVTNASLDKVGCLVVAQGGHDGLARCLVPAHTRVDGDALVAAATGRVAAPVDQVRLLAVVAVERAVRSLRSTA